MCGEGADDAARENQVSKHRQSEEGRSRRWSWIRIGAAAAVSAVVAAACGVDTSAGRGLDLDGLADCPDPLVIQTDWFPEPEHGAVYNLTRGEGSIDPETGRFTGPLAADPSITVEIRTGGPFLGSDSALTVMNDDKSIFLGYVNTDEAIANYSRHPTTAVVAPLDINPQMIMWDPATYQIKQWTEVKKTGATIHHFAGASYTEYLLETGLVLPDQLDDGYDGTPNDFIAARGGLIQQGFATQEPYLYQSVFDDWGKPVDYLLIHDAGYELYQGALTILDSRLDFDARSCLRSLVPLIQQSIVDYQRDPASTNDVILQAVADLDTFWQLTEEGVHESVIQMGLIGVVGNGDNQTVGDFDIERVEEVITITIAEIESVRVPAGLDADDLVSNEFIDDDIGL